jgi:hypothetical protein
VLVKLGQFYEVFITLSSNGSKLTTEHRSNGEVLGKTANDFLSSKLTREYIGRRKVHNFAIICRGKETKICKTLNSVLFYDLNQCSQVEMLTISFINPF